MRTTVRVGLVGCGKVASVHAAALAGVPEAELVACCDVDPERAAALAARFGIEAAYPDVDELLERARPDAVCVCTPHPTHAPVTLAAAAAGVHVLCEKPLSADLAQADAMVDAAERGGVKLGVVFQRRFWPASQRIRAAVDAGRLGALTLGSCSALLRRPAGYYRADAWRGTWAAEGGGALMNQAVHLIDLLQWYMGKAVEVHGRCATLRHGADIEVEDTAAATVAFVGGGLGVVTATTTLDPGLGFSLMLHGAAGSTLGLSEQPEGRRGVNHVWTLPDEDDRRAEWLREDADRPGFPDFHRLQIADFVRALLEDRPPAVTGADGRRSLELVVAIYRSAASGQPVRLPLSRSEPSPPPAEKGEHG